MLREFEHEMSVSVPSATQKALERFKDLNSGALENFKNKTLDIRNIIVDTVDSGITNMSKGLAKTLLLGNSIKDTFKNMAQTLAINVLSAVIEIVARKGAELLIEKMITREKQKQATFSKMGGGSGIGGSLLSIGLGFLGFAKGGAVSKGQPILVGENGPEMFVPNSTGQIEQSARGTDDGGTNINFTINATDVRGVKELLIDNRATIVNVINSALNEKGKEALV